MRTRLRFPILTALCLLAALPAAAAPVAISGQVTGKRAELQTGGKGAWQALAPLRKLEPGDRIRCGPDSRAVLVLLSSKERFQVEPGQEAEVLESGIRGAKSLGGLTGPAAATAAKLAGSRTGAFTARPAERFSPLFRGFKGWLPEGERRLRWEPAAGAATYVLSLFDARSNLVWQSERASAPEAELPAEKEIQARQPYLWRLVPYGASGRPLPAARWGVLTWLPRAEGEALDADAEALRAQDREDPRDPTALFLLAELYRQHGVLDGTLETLSTLQSRGVDGVELPLAETYSQLGPFARGLASVEPEDR